MNFASLTFWASLLVGLLVLQALRPFFKSHPIFDRVAFIILSLFLLGMESLETMSLFLWVAALGFLGLRIRTRWGIGIVIALIFAPLISYKYRTFLIEIFTGTRPEQSFLIPMGISFYTFQILSFVIDSRRREVGYPSWIDYLNFASFFPQIVAGPIERKDDLLPQVRRLCLVPRRENIEAGLPWIILGLFLKLAMAENFALLNEELRAVVIHAWQVWAEAVFYAFRIYFDFAGYSLIALGLGRCFGIRLTLNFRSPYLARNLQEFWRTWHITLSRWFRDYLYLPLGGSRTRGWVITVLFVFLVSGLWHGAGWNFLIWGLLHGVGVVACMTMKKRNLPKFFAWSLTMVLVLVSWLFFMERDSLLTFQKVLVLLDPTAYPLHPSSLVGMFQDQKSLLLAVMMLALAGAMMVVEWWSLKRDSPYDILLNRWVLLGEIAAIFFLAPAQESPFVYFNF